MGRIAYPLFELGGEARRVFKYLVVKGGLVSLGGTLGVEAALGEALDLLLEGLDRGLEAVDLRLESPAIELLAFDILVELLESGALALLHLVDLLSERVDQLLLEAEPGGGKG